MNDEPDATAVLAGAIDDINLSDLLVRAVVQSFYQPTPLGYQNQAITVVSQNGPVSGFAPVMQYGESPLQKTARMIFQAHESKIMEKVLAALDLDEVTTTIADEVLRKLKEPEDRHAYNRVTVTPEAIRTAVRDKIATDVAVETRARFEAEQNAMYQAWQREQRAAAFPVLES